MENPQEDNVQKGLNCGLEWFQFPDLQGMQCPGVPGACGHKSSSSEEIKRVSSLKKALEGATDGGWEGID